MSLRGFRSALSFRESARYLNDTGDVDAALRLVNELVVKIITEPLCTSQFFGSKKLDELCQLIGKKNYDDIKRSSCEIGLKERRTKNNIYIVTKLQKSGGHSKVIKAFINARANESHLILSTELDGPSGANEFLADFNSSIDISFEVSSEKNYQEKLTWLQVILLTTSPNKTYLFNHHQDSVATAAIQREMNLDASFYHHGDHNFCLGLYLSHLKHIDFHPMGYRYCRDVLGIENVYIPLSAEDKGRRSSLRAFMAEGALTTCTAARSNKVEVPYFVSYIDLVPELLNSIKGKHIHIGRLTPWALFRIRWGLWRRGIDANRFKYIPWVPSVWKALQENEVDLYIGSFPYGGGLTLIEAMGAGIPVALHRHVFSRVLSSLELAYPEAFNWRFSDELITYCKGLTSKDLEQNSNLGREHYDRLYSEQEFREAVMSDGLSQIKPSPLFEPFEVDNDEQYFQVIFQQTLKHLFLKKLYRALKKIRALGS